MSGSFTSVVLRAVFIGHLLGLWQGLETLLFLLVALTHNPRNLIIFRLFELLDDILQF